MTGSSLINGTEGSFRERVRKPQKSEELRRTCLGEKKKEKEKLGLSQVGFS